MKRKIWILALMIICLVGTYYLPIVIPSGRGSVLSIRNYASVPVTVTYKNVLFKEQTNSLNRGI